MGMGKLDICLFKDTTRSTSFISDKINSKEIKDHNVVSKALKVLEKNTGGTFQYAGISKNFLNMSWGHME